MGDMILYRSGGGSSVGGGSSSLDLVKNFSSSIGSKQVTLIWEDPDDVYDGEHNVIWAYTRIVRKAGSIPKNENDGIVVIESRVRNQYEKNGYVDSGLTNDTTYYYAAFPCSSDGSYGKIPALTCATPKTSFQTMSVKIYSGREDIATLCEYTNDAVGMPSGKTESATSAWQRFFGYRPCLLKNGSVIAYLNPKDYTKTIDGQSLNLDNNVYGDVMVEFPRCGISARTVSGNYGSYVYEISMTNNPDAEGYQYYAHTRGDMRCNNFYIGAYNGIINGGKLRSTHGKPTMALSNEIFLYQWRNYAHNNGNGYELMTFYQFQFLQCMYILQFKHTNSQTQVGYGYTGKSSRSDVLSNGTMDKNGTVYGTTNRSNGVKLFGIENLWGNCDCFIDGLVWGRNSEYDHTHLAFWYSATHNFTVGDPDSQEGNYSNWGYSMDSEIQCEGYNTAQEFVGWFGYSDAFGIMKSRYVFLRSGYCWWSVQSTSSELCDTMVGGEGSIDDDDKIRKDHPYVGVMPLVSGSSIYTDEVGIFYMDRIDSYPNDGTTDYGNKYPILVNARISYYHD